MTPPEGEDNLLGPIEDLQLPVDDPTLYPGLPIDLRFTCKSQQKREPTNGLELPTSLLRVIIHALQGLAGGCKSPISKLVSCLWRAACCTVLRSRWYQIGINTVLVATSDQEFPRVGPTTFVAMPQGPAIVLVVMQVTW